MKATWLNRRGNETLLLFFNGWGMDASPVRHLDPGKRDVLVLHDYRDPETLPEADAILTYRHIEVVAWSLGCAIANRVVINHSLRPVCAIAIAGTLTPEDDRTGIPPRWMAATLAHLDSGAWRKFLVRMRLPGSPVIDPPRPSETDGETPARRAELHVLRQLPPPRTSIFTHALVPRHDRIIRPDAQHRCWDHYHTPAHDLDAPHDPFNRWPTWDAVLRAAPPPPPAPLDKPRMALRFAQSGDTYATAAIQQSAMADGLLDTLLAASPRTHYPRVLELGCGTGLLTRRLLARLHVDRLHLNDITHHCAQTTALARTLAPACDSHACPGDMEQTPLPGDNDLVISNAVLHWAADPHALLQRLNAGLRPGGILATATYGPENMREIARLTGLTLPYWSLDRWRQALAAAHFESLVTTESLHTLHFANGIEALRHLQQTGVNALGHAPWRAGRTARLCRDYDRLFPSEKGVPLTYHPLILIARRSDAPAIPPRRFP